MKVANGRMHEAYSYSRRRWSNMYVVMVVVCSIFGCGILGLMRFHRLRERSSFSLLMKEKDEQILSLHLLLQKERDQMVEAKRQTEEMKMEIMSLESQKTELNVKIQDMQMKISSLTEEQNEAKLMREKDQNPQVEALMEKLRIKEAEIEDLKNATANNGEGKNEAETESSLTSKEESDKNNGTNSDGRIGEVERRDSEDQERERRENDDTKRENGERIESQSSDNQEVEVKLEKQEDSHIRSKRGYLRRAKMKRRRAIARASTMADKRSNAEESNGEGGEERPPGKAIQSNSSSEREEVSNQESAITNEANTRENEPLKEEKTEAAQMGDAQEREMGEEREETNEQEF